MQLRVGSKVPGSVTCETDLCDKASEPRTQAGKDTLSSLSCHGKACTIAIPLLSSIFLKSCVPLGSWPWLPAAPTQAARPAAPHGPIRPGWQ